MMKNMIVYVKEKPMNKLKKFLIKLIPNKKIRHAKLMQLRVHGNNNKIIGEIPLKTRLEIYGNNNKIIFGKNTQDFISKLHIGEKYDYIDNAVISIGDNCSAGMVDIRLRENNSYVNIGANTMISYDVNIWCSDTHSVLDSQNNITNFGKSIEIGDHVWIGMGVKIGKNTKIPSNSIVGWGSVVTKKFEKENIAIAGNPAKVIKENINWERKAPHQLLKERNK